MKFAPNTSTVVSTGVSESKRCFARGRTPSCPEIHRRDSPAKSRRSAAWKAEHDRARWTLVLPMTLQFLIVMIASPINDRLHLFRGASAGLASAFEAQTSSARRNFSHVWVVDASRPASLLPRLHTSSMRPRRASPSGRLGGRNMAALLPGGTSTTD
jgi:hypothetical protein